MSGGFAVRHMTGICFSLSDIHEFTGLLLEVTHPFLADLWFVFPSYLGFGSLSLWGLYYVKHLKLPEQ